MRFDEISENKSDEEIMKLLKKYFDIDAEVSIHNGKVNVNNDVEITSKIKFNKLPIEFDKVSGYFELNSARLTTLKGSPSFVGSFFSVNGNKLTSLEFGPEVVMARYSAFNNPITTLKYLPEQCREFTISYNDNLELLRLFYINELHYVSLYLGYDKHPIMNIINDALDRDDLNRQQKILLAKRELIKHGYESNARL